MRDTLKILKITLGVFLFTSTSMFAGTNDPVKIETNEVKTVSLKMKPIEIEPLAIEPLKHEALNSEVVANLNEDYLLAIADETPQNEADFLAGIISDYDIKEESGIESVLDEYNVIFISNKGYASVTYDNEGSIDVVTKHLRNVALPAKLVQLIHEEHRDWVIIQNKYTVSYSRGDDVSRTYRLTLQKGDQKKRIKVIG